MISIRNVHKYYHRGKNNEIHVINNACLDLPDKGMVAIFGRSGCGKTTLLNAIGGLDTFASGSILIDGKSLKKDTDQIRNKNIGYIFQNYNLNINETCIENVMDSLRLCGLKDEEEMKRRAKIALRNVDMDAYANRYPDTLSGGQQQRIAIARAIVKNPNVILADEPTGNLDESNTIMIMDLLHEIAKEHLVILVTHEANLVDYYCNIVVGIHDGVIDSIRNNEETNGYAAKEKNAIYLGELEQVDVKSSKANIHFYGDEPQEPIDFTFVNYHGKLYLRINTKDVQVLDSNSEVKLKEGVFAEKREESKPNLMEELPSVVEGKKFGQLFSFKRALINGFRANFHKKRAGKVIMSICMILFAVVLVFMTAACGVGIRNYRNVEDSYSHNTFYLYNPSADDCAKLMSAQRANEHGITDIMMTSSGYSYGNEYVMFIPGIFDSAHTSSLFYGYSLNYIEGSAMFKRIASLDSPNLVCGKLERSSNQDIYISSALADQLLEKSTFGHVTKYKDLIGVIYQCQDMNLSIRAIIKDSERTIYMSDDMLSRKYIKEVDLGIAKASDYGIQVEEGKIQYWYIENISTYYQIEEPSVGDAMLVNGISLHVSKVDILSEDSTAEYRQGYYEFGGLLSDKDYEKIALSIGETDNRLYNYGKQTTWDSEIGLQVIEKANVLSENYILIRSNNVKETENYLNSFVDPEQTETQYGDDILVTPEKVGVEAKLVSGVAISIYFIVMGLFLVLMCVCMYFIMRANFMSRIREVGIYRAIGVTKKNLYLRFRMEVLSLTTLTVFVGFIFTSLLIRKWVSVSLLSNVFYYPLWLALILLVTMYGICLTCGMIPVKALLKKTPSSILAKYDI